MKIKKVIPKSIKGTKVKKSGSKPFEIAGGIWHTLLPVDKSDERILGMGRKNWSYNPNTIKRDSKK